MELATRKLDGYPDTTIRLDFEVDGSSRVTVTDPLGETVLHDNGDRARAKDCYFHPFAFGYRAPESDIDGVDFDC